MLRNYTRNFKLRSKYILENHRNSGGFFKPFRKAHHINVFKISNITIDLRPDCVEV